MISTFIRAHQTRRKVMSGALYALMGSGMTQNEAARHLGVTQSAVAQRPRIRGPERNAANPPRPVRATASFSLLAASVKDRDFVRGPQQPSGPFRFFRVGERSGKHISMDFHELSRRGVSRPLTPKSLRPKKEANKMTDCKTSAGMNILVQLGRFLFHEEFRLLFAFSDFPCGSHFEISGHRCTAHHGFAAGEAESVPECRKLKKLPIGPLNAVKYGGSFSFIWRLP